jgi:hypothetical protein
MAIYLLTDALLLTLNKDLKSMGQSLIDPTLKAFYDTELEKTKTELKTMFGSFNQSHVFKAFMKILWFSR